MSDATASTQLDRSDLMRVSENRRTAHPSLLALVLNARSFFFAEGLLCQ